MTVTSFPDWDYAVPDPDHKGSLTTAISTRTTMTMTLIIAPIPFFSDGPVAWCREVRPIPPYRLEGERGSALKFGPSTTTLRGGRNFSAASRYGVLR
jgi:hypothetical protein